MSVFESIKTRRTFLGRLGALLAAGAAPGVLGASATTGAGQASPRGLDFASSGLTASGAAPDERWLLAASQREHRLFIETGVMADAVAFRRAMNFLDAYEASYGISEEKIGLVIGLHGGAISLALNDEMWARHKLGERFNMKDANGVAHTTHPFKSGTPFSLAALSARGAHFLACNKSLLRVARELTPAGGDAAAMHHDLVAGVIAPMIVVPAMAVAVSRAQQAGIPYLMHA